MATAAEGCSAVAFASVITFTFIFDIVLLPQIKNLIPVSIFETWCSTHHTRVQLFLTDEAQTKGGTVGDVSILSSTTWGKEKVRPNMFKPL